MTWRWELVMGANMCMGGQKGVCVVWGVIAVPGRAV